MMAMITNVFDECRIGDILWGQVKLYPEARHPIVYLGKHKKNSSFFCGLMLTTDDTEKENILMKPEHFEGGFIYNNTHVVDVYLLKPMEWGPFKPLGNLTERGLDFVHENIKMDNPKIWDQHLMDKM